METTSVSAVKSSHERFLRAALWNLLGSVAAKGLPLIASILVARHLGPESFGALSMVQTTAAAFAVLGTFGLGITATKFVAELKHRDRRRASEIIALTLSFAAVAGTLCAGALFFFADVVAASLLAIPDVALELRLVAPLLLFSALASAYAGALAGFEAFRLMAKMTLLSGSASAAALVIGANLHGVSGAVMGLVIAQAFSVVLLHLALWRECARQAVAFQLWGGWGQRSVLVGFSTPAVLSSLLVAPTNWVCIALLARQPDGVFQVGLYSAANQWRLAVYFVPAVLAASALPILSDLLGSKDERGITTTIRVQLPAVALVGLLMSITLALLSELIMLTYGPGFEEGHYVLVLLAISAALMSLNAVLGQVLTAMDKMWLGFFLNFVWAIAIVAATIFCLDRFPGAIALAWASLVAYGIHTVLQFTAVWSLQRMSPN